MGKETGIVRPWEAEREIKQGAKHAEYECGEKKGRMKALKLGKQPGSECWDRRAGELER